jgi:hypothetical protein
MKAPPLPYQSHTPKSPFPLQELTGLPQPCLPSSKPHTLEIDGSNLE